MSSPNKETLALALEGLKKRAIRKGDLPKAMNGVKFFSPITNEMLLAVERSILPKAIEGHYPSVCDLLMLLSEALAQSVPLTPALASYLAGALRKISGGGDPKAAFNIIRKRGGRNTQAAVEQNVLLACRVARLRSKKPSQSVEEAIAEIAEDSSVPEETVKAAWRDYRHSVELRDGGALLTFAKLKKKEKE